MTGGRTVDLEVAELLRDEPRLLAIADAIVATQPRHPHRRMRYSGRRLPVAAAALALAAGVALTAPWQGHGNGVVDRALAAVGGGPVLHAVIEGEIPNQSLVTLATGKRAPARQRLAYWYDGGRRRLRVVGSVGGRIAFDVAPSRPASAGLLDPALTAFVSGYREALRRGEAREVGRGVFDGHKVIWLRFDYRLFGERVGVAAASYRPLVIEPLNANGTPASERWRIRAIATTDYRAADFRPTSPPLARSNSRTGRLRIIDPTIAAQLLGWAPLWPGRSFRGRPLQYAQLKEMIRERPLPRRTTAGLMLAYGRGTDRIQVTEAPTPEPLYGYWRGRPLPALGTALLTMSSMAGGPVTSECQAQLRTHGLWLTITGWNRASSLCVAVARALQPIGGRSR